MRWIERVLLKMLVYKSNSSVNGGEMLFTWTGNRQTFALVLEVGNSKSELATEFEIFRAFSCREEHECLKFHDIATLLYMTGEPDIRRCEL